MNEILRSFALVGMIYDEEGFVPKFLKMFRDAIIVQVWRTKTDYFALLSFAGHPVIVIRGTGGRNLKKWLAAWRRNFRIEADEFGRARGFADSARSVVDSVIDPLLNLFTPQQLTHIEICGHSAGGPISIIAAEMLSRKLLTEHRIKSRCNASAFGAPPPGNADFARLWGVAHGDGRVDAHRWDNPRDVVTTAFRSGVAPFDGVDVGIGTRLPPDTWIQRVLHRISGVIEHSPREYCDGLRVMFGKQSNWPAVEDCKRIRKELVN